MGFHSFHTLTLQQGFRFSTHAHIWFTLSKQMLAFYSFSVFHEVSYLYTLNPQASCILSLSMQMIDVHSPGRYCFHIFDTLTHQPGFRSSLSMQKFGVHSPTLILVASHQAKS